MRIRKNAKISQFSSISSTPSSSTSISNPILLKTNQLQCQLNQSPWDIITFPIPPPPQEDSSSPHFQEDEYFGVAGNGSFDDDSIEATHSSGRSKKAVIMGSEQILLMNNDRKWNSCEVDVEDRDISQLGFNVHEGAKGNVEDDVMLCCETKHRKGWQCGREVKKGHKVCARHLRYVSTVVGGKNSANNIMTPAARRGRPPKKKKVELPVDPNPYEFYYYSGFGPLRGKKKGLIKRTTANVTTGNDHEIVTSATKHEEAKRRIELDKEIDNMESCDDSEEEEEEIGKKRGRKRIKARSLKSLM